ncbi:MAG: hypothetical protein CL942_06740 [Desulfovibrio sp.]|nr:hypothetical protein [Desulfovibrio sp.]|tara:strand:+ start:17957 stop:19234 length:1278 start_codon:yes stop_codon:yes gene_type:complete
MSSTVEGKGYKLGWPLPARKDCFATRIDHAEHSWPVTILGKLQHLKILHVSIGLPKYRLLNGRTASLQKEYLAQNSDLASDFFSRDYESEEAQKAQHQLLKELVKRKDLLSFFENPKQKQEQPLILDENGYVVNGNRRLCAWRELYKRDDSAFDHFEHIEVVVLPPCDEEDINDLEAKLQIVPDIKDEYSWHALGNRIRQRLSDGAKASKVMKQYQMKKKDFDNLLQALDYAEVYLKKKGSPQQWSHVPDEHSFRRIAENAKTLSSPGDKKLFRDLCFALIDDPQKSGRVYEQIRYTRKYFDSVKKALNEEFSTEEPKENSGLDILGTSDETTSSMPLAAEIEKTEDQGKVAEVVRDTIVGQEQLDRDKKTSNFLLKQLQKANTALQDALNNGLKPESNTKGTSNQIESIEAGLDKIKAWLEKNA